MSQLTLSFDTPLMVRDGRGRYRPADADQILEAARQVIEQKMQRGAEFTSPVVVKDYLRAKLAGFEHEVFAVLFLAVGTFGRAVAVFLTVPLGLAGGVFALALTGISFSVSAAVGFIALFGIALGNGMVLVSFMDDFAREGRGRDELAVEAAGLRARPVLMTALTTALGLAPLLFASGVGAEVQRPLATVVMGGLVSSTVLTLLVLPALHRWFAPKPDAHHSLLEAEHVHPS